MADRIIGFDPDRPGTGLPAVVEQRLDGRYSGGSGGGVGVSLEDDTGYHSRPDAPLVIWRGVTDPRELPEFVVGVDLWAQTTPSGGGEEEPQVTWFTDFSTDTVGNIPAGWSVDWTQDKVVAQIVDDSGTNLFQVGRSDIVSPGLSLIRWDDVPAAADVEIVVRWRGLSDAAQFFPTALRARGTVDAPYAYAAGLATSDEGRIRAYMGSLSNVPVSPNISATYLKDQWRWTRLRVEGSTISVRFWLDGEVEPGVWTASVTHTGIPEAGSVGMLATYINRQMDVSQVGVGIDGATAPVSA